MIRKTVLRHFALHLLAACALVMLFACSADAVEQFVRPQGAPVDVLPEYNNLPVTALTEDCESVRLALGAAWDDAMACRALSGYLRPWSKDDSKDAAEAVVKRGTMMYEIVKCIDDGIQSVRLARDSRDEPKLMDDVAFWQNELSLAAVKVIEYATDAATLKAKLARQLAAAAAQEGISSEQVASKKWDNPEREAWRKAGPMCGIRLPLDPHPESFAAWWNTNLSFEPGYIVGKFRAAGDAFVAGEVPVGAWGYNTTPEGDYDWTRFNNIVSMLKERKCSFLLELPTLTKLKTAEEAAAEASAFVRHGWWIWSRYAPALPANMQADQSAALLSLDTNGKPQVYGGVQLFNPKVQKAYGAYLKEMAANLKKQGLYETIAAVHLDIGDSTGMPDEVDYSPFTKELWQKFMQARYATIDALNKAAGTDLKSFDILELPAKRIDPPAEADWQEFARQGKTNDANAWGNYLTDKYKNDDTIQQTLGASYREAYGWRLPYDYPPVIKIDYLHFRRVWMKEYLSIKRQLTAAAFPDKLLIAEMRQMGDHDGIAGVSEKKWGGLLGDDFGQCTGVGPKNEDKPFMSRSVGPPGFGTRPSDSLESLYSDYLWINFRDPGNLARYFYDWVSHGYLDYQFGWHSVTNHWLTNQLVYNIGPTVASTAPKPQRIGLLMPRATLDLNDGPIYYDYMGWDWIMQAAKLAYSRVDEHLVLDGKLAGLGLELLVVPAAKAMDPKVAAAIEQWVANGGTLLVSTIPGETDQYNRPLAELPMAKVLGATLDGTTSEAVKDTPLTITIPRGIFTGGRAEKTDRRPTFEVLKPTTATVMAAYESGKPAITVNTYGKGKAVTMGYPFGREATEADRTSIGFQRTYTWFVREPQVVQRAAWLRKFIVDDLGYRAEYGVDYAEVARFEGKEARALGVCLPKGFSEDPANNLFIRTVGDPRPNHELELKRETPDAAIRFFPRHRDGVNSTFLGISTREVHYIAPRGTVNMHLSQHTYRCRINNPKVQAIWDVARDVPVGFERDDKGVAFHVSLPSGHIMMLAYSEGPKLQLFGRGAFTGRGKDEVLARCKALAGGTTPPPVVILTKDELRPWVQGLVESEKGKKVLVSYGEAANKPAADKLAAALRETFGIAAEPAEQVCSIEDPNQPDVRVKNQYSALVYIGNEWNNNDLALQGAFWNWNSKYDPHVPFTSTYAWPGKGRAVVSLSRRYALITQNGDVMNQVFRHDWRVRKVEDRFGQVRRRLHIGADGEDAVRAVDAVVEAIGK